MIDDTGGISQKLTLLSDFTSLQCPRCFSSYEDGARINNKVGSGSRTVLLINGK
jgi:hypothetical protein